MALYLLKWRGTVPWDGMASCVVRAESEEAARNIAQAYAGDEARPWYGRNKDASWESDVYASCEWLRVKGDAGMVCRDFKAG